MTGKLVIVPTPLGNLGDMTLRSLEALREADVVCAEDTRITRKLLSHFGIEVRVERLDETLMRSRATRVVDCIAAGDVIAYCSDAGMPGVSDPGLRLVAAVREAGLTVEVLPGASAAVTAYVASGSGETCFYFGGFFPRKEAEQKALLECLRPLEAALVFYESPRRLMTTLCVLAEVLPHREVAVCRELTKLHEEVVRGSAQEVREVFKRRETEPGGIRGEIAFVIDGPSLAEKEEDRSAALASAEDRIAELAAQGMRTKEIAKLVSDEFGIARNEAYERAMRTLQAK